MSPPPYSIVVVTWQCARHLARLVETMNQHLGGDEELIVVDNGSDDDPESAARRWRGPLTFVPLGENAGFGAANNAAVARTESPAVVMLNPDTELLDGRLANLAGEALARRGLVGPRVLFPDGSVQPSASGPEVGAWPWVRAVIPGAISPRPLQRRTEPYRLSTATRVTWLTGSCIAGPREVLKALGPFDPALHLYGEDTDLGLRAQAAGVPVWFCPETCEIVHHGEGSSILKYGSEGGWLRDGARNWRAALRRAYGERRERRALRALKLNLRVRIAAKRVLGREAARPRAALEALLKATSVPELPPVPAPSSAPGGDAA